jgi:hypothetical protein
MYMYSSDSVDSGAMYINLLEQDRKKKVIAIMNLRNN